MSTWHSFAGERTIPFGSSEDFRVRHQYSYATDPEWYASADYREYQKLVIAEAALNEVTP